MKNNQKSFLPKIPDVFAATVDNHWSRFVEAVSRLPDDQRPSDMLELCLSRPEISVVWAASDFVANTCISKPHLLYQLITSGDLDRPYPDGELICAITHSLAGCREESDLHSRLRRVRQREMVRVAWRDLSSAANLEETMECISELAEGCIDQALSYHNQWLSQRYGQPRSETGELANMIVLGLGKLGGGELNYSSDVDLIFAYDNPGQTVHTSDDSQGIDNQEYFIKLGRKIVTALDTVTRDGFVFRTDMRLRPNGDSGALVLSFSAMEHYYQTHGRNWERYAFIKARVVAGKKTAGEEILATLKPFVYRKYLDFSAFDSIREMKGMIKRELKQKGLTQDIKLGRGGIREIEFLVQSHQLIRGGREKNLQTPSLYQALTCLLQLGVIGEKALQQLMEGYRFLRNTEHRLQMVADRQTQQLPQSELEQQRLAWSMDFDCWDSFSNQLDQHRTNVHDQFRMILDEDAAQSGGKEDTGFALVDLWQGKLELGEAVTALRNNGFARAESTPQLLRSFREGRLYQAFSGVERDRIDRLMPLALKQAAEFIEAEWGMAAFISVIEAIGRRSVYLSLLIENPIALKQLLHLCAASPWISSHIGKHPVILDELLNPLVDIRNRSDEELRGELDHRLAQVEDDDEEGRMNTLREFHHAQVLRIAAADVSGVLKVDDVHYAQTQLAEVLLQNVFNQAIHFVEQKLGEAPSDAGVIAYGKFASGELGYHSDLDVVVCYEKINGKAKSDSSDPEHFYSRVGRRLIHLLTTRTQAGILYQLDMRLRPSGRSGTLVASLAGFFEYQRSKAWTWEHQALVRSRVVVGNSNFRHQFEQVRQSILCLERDIDRLKIEIIEMRQKMIDANCQSTSQVYDIKLDKGGIVDIEFLIQYWVLLHAKNTQLLVEPRSTADSISVLVAHSIIDNKTGETLLTCYETYLRHSLNLKLMDRPVLARQDELSAERSAIESIWNETFS